eukprot:6200498-Pleurochrysis_carterae.AAC.1
MLRAIVAHAFGALRVHCCKSFSTSARLWLKRACRSSAVIVVPLIDSWLPCVTTAGDAATTAFASGTTIFASTFSPTCASVASRPRIMRLCDALLSTSTFLSLIATVFLLSVRSGRSTSHLYLGVVVPFAVTLTVVMARRLPFTASKVSVIQCIPAPVSPSHMVLAPIAAIGGIACMADA